MCNERFLRKYWVYVIPWIIIVLARFVATETELTCGASKGQFLFAVDVGDRASLELNKDVTAALSKELDKMIPESTFGLISFTDKPSTHSVNDYCFRIDQKLQPNHVNMVDKLKSVESPSNQSKEPQADLGSQLDALYYGLTTKDIEWDLKTVDADNAEEPFRCLILITSRGFQTAGLDSSLPPPMLEDRDSTCYVKDYPSISLIKTALQRRNSTLLVITTDSSSSFQYQLFENFAGRQQSKVIHFSEAGTLQSILMWFESAACSEDGYGPDTLRFAGFGAFALLVPALGYTYISGSREKEKTLSDASAQIKPRGTLTRSIWLGRLNTVMKGPLIEMPTMSSNLTMSSRNTMSSTNTIIDLCEEPTVKQVTENSESLETENEQTRQDWMKFMNRTSMINRNN